MIRKNRLRLCKLKFRMHIFTHDKIKWSTFSPNLMEYISRPTLIRRGYIEKVNCGQACLFTAKGIIRFNFSFYSFLFIYPFLNLEKAINREKVFFFFFKCFILLKTVHIPGITCGRKIVQFTLIKYSKFL